MTLGEEWEHYWIIELHCGTIIIIFMEFRDRLCVVLMWICLNPMCIKNSSSAFLAFIGLSDIKIESIYKYMLMLNIMVVNTFALISVDFWIFFSFSFVSLF